MAKFRICPAGKGKFYTQVHGPIKYKRKASKAELKDILDQIIEESEVELKEIPEGLKQIDPLLNKYHLHNTYYKNSIVLQNNNDESIDIKILNEDFFMVSYLAIDREVAKITLKDCPDLIKEWYSSVSSFDDKPNYKRLPYFSGTFKFKDAVDVCSYLCNKMILNEKLEDAILN